MDTHSGRRVLFGGGLFGFGFGAVLDVVVFHLILQWHHLLSTRYPPTSEHALRTNVFFDGVFVLVMLGMMTVGAALVWRASNRSSTAHSSLGLFGSVLTGIGAFNLFDGTVDHYVLDAHDVVHGTAVWNPHWVGASLILLGFAVSLLARHRE